MKMKRFGAILVAALALSMALVLVGCSSNNSSDDKASEEASYTLVADGKLTVGTSPDYPPFENLEDGEYVGFDIALAEAIAKELGLEVEYQTLQFDGILTAVAAGGQVDVGISGISVDPERAETVDFSDAYYIDDQAVAAMSDGDFAGVKDIDAALNKKGVVIAVQSGTTGESYVKENYPKATVQPYGNSTDAFAAMQAGQADVVCTNKAVVEQMLASAYDNAEVVKTVATGEEYAVAVSKDNPELTAAINKALATLSENGTIDGLITEYMS